MKITKEFAPVTLKIETLAEKNIFIHMLQKYEYNERQLTRWGYRPTEEAILAAEILQKIIY